MSRYYMGAAGPHGKLHHHFSQIIGPFESKEAAQLAAKAFDQDFPGYMPWVDEWPEHWPASHPRPIQQQLSEARVRLAAIQAEIAQNGDKPSPEDEWPLASPCKSMRISA